MNSNTKRLTTTGVLIALGTILSIISVFKLPYGGEVTLASMVPVIFLGYKYGVKWGLFSGFVYSLLQGVLGATMSQAFAGMYDPENAAVSILKIVLMAFLDYIVAFSVLGLSGMFKNKIKNDNVSITLGAAVVVLLRYLTHFISGYILWGSYAEWFFTDAFNNSLSQNIMASYSGKALAALYSLIYNGTYMIPELIITVVVVAALMLVKPIKRIVTNND